MRSNPTIRELEQQGICLAMHYADEGTPQNGTAYWRYGVYKHKVYPGKLFIIEPYPDPTGTKLEEILKVLDY
jgi:hypothetical protein